MNNGHKGSLVTDTCRAANAPIPSNSVTDTTKPGLLFDVNVDHVARNHPLVSPNRHRWLQVFQTHQTVGGESATKGGEVKSHKGGGVNLVGAVEVAEENVTLNIL
jgi:hypothetical protein